MSKQQHAFFFVHFIARLRRENALCHVLSRGREHKTTTFFLISWTVIKSFRINSKKKLPTFNELNVKFEAARLHFLSGAFVAVDVVVA